MRALSIASTGMAAAILLAIYAPERAFLALYGIAVAGMFFVWTVILITHVAFRHSMDKDRIARLPMHLRLYPYSAILGILALLGIAAATFFVPGLEHTVPAFALFLVVITIVYWIANRAGALSR